jgi:hypothetical protein
MRSTSAILHPRRQPRPHRIERDVAQRRGEMRLVHGDGDEPPLPEMTTAFAARLASLVQCSVTIDARYGTSDPDNSCPATNPELTYGFRRRRKFELHGGV